MSVRARGQARHGCVNALLVCSVSDCGGVDIRCSCPRCTLCLRKVCLCNAFRACRLETISPKMMMLGDDVTEKARTSVGRRTADIGGDGGDGDGGDDDQVDTRGLVGHAAEYVVVLTHGIDTNSSSDLDHSLDHLDHHNFGDGGGSSMDHDDDLSSDMLLQMPSLLGIGECI